MQHILMLDLQDDPEKIKAYIKAHEAIWPEVSAHLSRHGVTSMQIHRLGTRMVMVMHTDDKVFDAKAFDKATREDPVIQRWEKLMWTYQAPTPWTPAGSKWTVTDCIFDWTA